MTQKTKIRLIKALWLVMWSVQAVLGAVLVTEAYLMSGAAIDMLHATNLGVAVGFMLVNMFVMFIGLSMIGAVLSSMAEGYTTGVIKEKDIEGVLTNAWQRGYNAGKGENPMIAHLKDKER